ncbi:MAG: gliding motility-associated C-terminal domain-containing protein [Ferruginibacter sp.]
MRALLFILFFFLLQLAGLDARSQDSGPGNMRLADSIFYLKQLDYKMHGNQKPLYVDGHHNNLSLQKTIPSVAAKNKTNSICHDTSGRIILINDTVVYYTKDPYPTADGNYLLSGQYILNLPPYTKGGGFLLKFDINGNILWHKIYDSLNNTGYNFLNYYNVMELRDGSIFLAGSTNNQITGNDDLVFTRLDNAGNLVWSKVYKSRLWGNGSGSADYYYVQQMKEDPVTGEIYITGPFWVAGSSLIKLDATNGNLLWSKSYSSDDGNFDNPFGLDIKQNEIRLFSRFLANPKVVYNIRTIDKQTGDTIQNKYFVSNDTSGNKSQMLGRAPLTVLNNGHYSISGSCYGYYVFNWNGVTPLYHAAYIEFDENLNFVKANAFKNSISSNNYNTCITIHPDGSGFFTMLHYVSSYTGDVYSIQFNNDQFLKQRRKHTQGDGVPYEPHTLPIPGQGDMIARLMGDSITNIAKIEILKLHPSDTASSCLGYDDQSTYLYPFQIVPLNWSADSVRSDVFQENPNKTFTAHPFGINRLPGCFSVSGCDSLELTGSANSICLSQALQVTAHRNTGCGSNVSWQYNTAVVSAATQLNDSTVSFQFNSVWSGYIYASIPGCTTIVDSVYINVLQAPVTLDLGPDTTICPGNIITLNAHTGYASYTWQDGSADSTFSATLPGTYFLQANDACGSIFHDTIVISPHAPVSLYAGPDRTKCNTDTIHLQAPNGFISYSWSPNYSISALNTQSVIVNPSTDTSYFLQAAIDAGCYAFDTIHITVHHSTPINLGNDTSLCTGNSLTLDAGLQFTSFAWNTGSNSQQIIVNTAGDFFVTATDANNCRSTDTISVINVYPLPVVSLEHNTGLCIGSTHLLEAGTFNSYLWQDGSVASTFIVTGTGNYYVTVIDSHGCKGSDTVKIVTIYPRPADFLPADTTLCNFEKKLLQPIKTYSNYLWNTNSISPSIVINQPGNYWLQVTDNNGCVGRDSIVLIPKECLHGLYVPAAFTPNTDATNDRLRGMLFGTIEKYAFSVYNRYGQLVFQAANPEESWNGNFHGAPQSTGTYVWICKYRLAGESEKTEHGTTVLIR